MNISDEAVKTALFQVESIHHIHGNQCLCGFKSHVSRDRTKHIMEATLEAAAPHLMAQAWDGAYRAGIDDILRGERTNPRPNPYRAEVGE